MTKDVGKVIRNMLLKDSELAAAVEEERQKVELTDSKKWPDFRVEQDALEQIQALQDAVDYAIITKATPVLEACLYTMFEEGVHAFANTIPDCKCKQNLVDAYINKIRDAK